MENVVKNLELVVTIVSPLFVISLEISRRAIYCHLCMFKIGVEKKV